MVIARRYLIRGIVQGVGFRFFVDDAARREGLGGFVRNRDDGGVEVVVEGETEAVARFERAISQGPPHARVEKLEIEPADLAGRLAHFEIRG